MSMSTQQSMQLAVPSADILCGERVIMSSNSLPNELEWHSGTGRDSPLVFFFVIRNSEKGIGA